MYLYIAKIPGGYQLKHYPDNSVYPEIRKYYFYSIRQAEKLYRTEYGLKGKHLHKIYI